MNVWDAFEVPTIDERTNLPMIEQISKLYIDGTELGLSPSEFCLDHPRLEELIQEYNNKVGTLIMTYTLAFHYFNAGIPDDRWSISPGKQGQSVQYMPDFTEEHWGRNLWFGYFANVYYLTLYSIWDSVIEIINHYYDYDYPPANRQRKQVMEALKKDHRALFDILDALTADPIYKKAQEYRTAAAHGTTPNTVTDRIQQDKDIPMDFPVLGENGMPVVNEDGTFVTRKAKVRRIQWRIGKYATTQTIFQNMQEYAILSAGKIHEILSLMCATKTT